MSVDAPGPASPAFRGSTSRRRVLALLGAGGAASLATPLSRDEAQAGHDGTNVFHLGQHNSNPPGTSTSLHASGGGDGLTIFGGLAIQGPPGGGGRLRVFGTTDPDESDPALDVTSSFGAINGTAPHPEGAGVQGIGAPPETLPREGVGTGVRGWTGAGRGVQGIAVGTGTGVEARCGALFPGEPGGGPVSLDGHALVVRGRSAFSTVGSAVMPAGDGSAFVANPAVTSVSHITVTLASNPGPRQLSWVERSPGSGFTVHLTSAPRRQRAETALTYMIAEPT